MVTMRTPEEEGKIVRERRVGRSRHRLNFSFVHLFSFSFFFSSVFSFPFHLSFPFVRRPWGERDREALL